tara:strand:+ start:53534 stop:54433 length:900 start_codon:yes stop_codon:yes gene_type:complete
MNMFAAFGRTFKKGDFKGAMNAIVDERAGAGLPHGALMDDYIFSEEHYWLNKTKRNVIYPETEVDVVNLLNADYDVDDAKGFNFPMSNFVFTLPANFEYDGVRLPSFMVTYMRTADHVKTVTNALLSDFHRPEGNVMVKPENLDKNALAIIIPTDDGEFSRVMTHHTTIPLLLRSKTIKEYQTHVGNMSDATLSGDLNEYESKQQFLALKLVSAFSAYVSAGEEEALTVGMRDPKARESCLPKGVKTVTAYTFRTVFGRNIKDKKKWADEPETQLFVSRKSNTWNVKKLQTKTDFGGLD